MSDARVSIADAPYYLSSTADCSLRGASFYDDQAARESDLLSVEPAQQSIQHTAHGRNHATPGGQEGVQAVAGRWPFGQNLDEATLLQIILNQA